MLFSIVTGEAPSRACSAVMGQRLHVDVRFSGCSIDKPGGQPGGRWHTVRGGAGTDQVNARRGPVAHDALRQATSSLFGLTGLMAMTLFVMVWLAPAAFPVSLNML
jgi:predicted secreted protein